MTPDIERDDFEEVLRRFRPMGPSTELKVRALTIESRRSWSSSRRIVFAGGALAAAAIVAVALLQRGAPRDGQVSSSASLTVAERRAFEEGWKVQRRVPLGIPADGASVLLVEFVDWLCPPCAGTHRVTRQLAAAYEERHPGRVRHVVADSPWDADCNAAVTTTLHPGACAAAAVVRMARSRGQGEAMADWLFDNQPAIAALGPAEAVTKVQAGAVFVLGAVDLDREYAGRFEELRRELGSRRTFTPDRTPLLFVNGVRVSSDMRPEYLDLAIRMELENPRPPARGITNEREPFGSRERGFGRSEAGGYGRRGRPPTR